MKTDKSHYIIGTVSRALDLLEQFHGDVGELGVSELSRRLSLHKNNVFRLLATLESRHYVEKNLDTGSYRLGLKNLELGQATIRQLGLLRQARPVLESMTSQQNETTYVAVLKGSDVVYLDSVESPLPVRVVPRLGAWLPAHCTAAGKVLLAFMSDKELDLHLPDELHRYTSYTITDRDELRRQLRMVSELGYAIDDQELDVGVRSVSAPIRDYTKKVVGAVSVSGPAIRFSDERMAELIIPLAREGAAEISFRLGYPRSDWEVGQLDAISLLDSSPENRIL